MDVEEFIGKKSYKAKGKKVSPYNVLEVRFVEPLDKSDVEEVEEVEQNEDMAVGESSERADNDKKGGDDNGSKERDDNKRKEDDVPTTPVKEKSKPEPVVVDQVPRELTLF